jgi:hypothetical protein
MQMSPRLSRFFFWSRFAAAICCVAGLNVRAFGYGREGHQTVGALADLLIAGTPAAAKVQELLGTESLGHASTWADEVEYGPKNAETQAYADRNEHHARCHYTDIPIQDASYDEHSPGAAPHDVVHALGRCIAVLKSGNDTAEITQKEALKLLVHFVGDIHQPLHVGAAYMKMDGKLVHPATPEEAEAAQDHGGNWIMWKRPSGQQKFHSYWDGTTVTNAMNAAAKVTPPEFAEFLKDHESAGWKSASPVEAWPREWANEMLPLARQMHEKITIGPATSVTEKNHLGEMVTHPRWPATCADVPAYDLWAGDLVTKNLTRAGFRLAAVLKSIWP